MDPLLRDLLVDTTPEDLMEFHAMSRTFTAEGGEVIYDTGTVPRGLALVFAGRIAIEKDGVRVAEFGRGSYFGERTLVADEPVFVQLIAIEPTECLEFPREPARRFLVERPAFGYAILKALFTGNLARLSATNRTLLEARTLARTLEAKNRELADSLARLAAMQEELAHAQHLAAIGTMVAGVAHEINNPLGYVAQSIETAIERGSALPAEHWGRLQKPLERAREGAGRIRHIVDDLRGIGKAERLQAASCDADQEVAAVLRMVEQDAKDRGVTIAHEPRGAGAVAIAPTKLGQVLVNIARNACDASPAGSTVRVDAVREGDQVVFRVCDAGAGIPADVRPRIFDPFFTTKPVGQGSGLGLWVCRNIVTAAGGAIELDSAAGQGTTFTIRLPGGTAR
jgi:signal transduction histidine kinase